MSPGHRQFENFLEALRNSLAIGAEKPSRDDWNQIVTVTRKQISLLPAPFSAVFLASLALTLFFFQITPGHFQPLLLRLWRRLPGFSAILLFHEKIMAAAELELQEIYPGNAIQ